MKTGDSARCTVAPSSLTCNVICLLSGKTKRPFLSRSSSHWAAHLCGALLSSPRTDKYLPSPCGKNPMPAAGSAMISKPCQETKPVGLQQNFGILCLMLGCLFRMRPFIRVLHIRPEDSKLLLVFALTARCGLKQVCLACGAIGLCFCWPNSATGNRVPPDVQ